MTVTVQDKYSLSKGASSLQARRPPNSTHMNDISLPRSVHIAEVGPRDGLQIESTRLSEAQKLELIDALAGAGLREIEVGSFVNPRAVPQMADTPQVFAVLKKRPGVAYRAIWLNMRGLERAIQAEHVDLDAKLAITASETFARRNTNRSVDEAIAEIPEWVGKYRSAGIGDASLTVMAAFGCNFDGRIPQERVVGLVERCVRMAADNGLPLTTICLADTMGWANPLQVRQMVSTLQDRWPHIGLKLHLHDTRGCAVANAVAAMELGVRSFDAAVGGLGGCPFAGHQGAAGNLCTEDLVFACQEMGIETGVDLDALVEVSRWLEGALGHSLPGKVMKGGSVSRFVQAH